MGKALASALLTLTYDMKTDLIDYYGRRAEEYERIYAKAERQSDLGSIKEMLRDAFRDHEVLEIACGTAYWTEVIVQSAKSVMACDVSPEVLHVARHKSWGSAAVDFRQADAYALPEFGRQFSAAFAGFWWSHIPQHRIAEFLHSMHAKLSCGSRVVFIDNRYVEGSSTPIARTDEQGNSYQLRKLKDGSIHEVLKNFPSKEELLHAVADKASAPEVTFTDYFWILSYELK